MQISLQKPPIFDRCAKEFGIKETDVIWFTYGDCIYAPCKVMPPDYIIRHEEVHAEQQRHSEAGAREWWDRYFADKDFRMDQEAEAYGAQFKFMRTKKEYRDRNVQAKVLRQIGQNLSGKVYGHSIGLADAMKLVRAYADGTALNGIEDHLNEDREEI